MSRRATHQKFRFGQDDRSSTGCPRALACNDADGAPTGPTPSLSDHVGS